MNNIFQRSEMVIGKNNIDLLSSKKVLVFGLGGVGGSLCEALVRSGIGEIHIVDRDVVDITNLNRQIIATLETIGMAKTDALEKRLLSINKNLVVKKYKLDLNKDSINDFNFEDFDYVADAIDTVSAKILLIENCYKKGVKIISAMGAGNKIDPTKLVIEDIYKTHTCPLAKVMRKELKDRGVKNLKVVYSTESPIKPKFRLEKESSPGSMSFVPPVSGMIMASVIVRDLINLGEV